MDHGWSIKSDGSLQGIDWDGMGLGTIGLERKSVLD